MRHKGRQERFFLLVAILAVAAWPAHTPAAEPQQGEPVPWPPPGEAAPLAPPQIERQPAESSFVILFTGRTRAALDVIRPDMGGLSRRATLIANTRRQGTPVLVLDAGGLFDGTEVYDRLRAALYLRMVTLLGYRALNLSPSELRFGWAWFAETLREYPEGQHPPVVSTNVFLPPAYRDLPIHSAGVAEVGLWRLGIVGFAYPREPSNASERENWGDLAATAGQFLKDLRRQVDALVALADLPRGMLADLAAVSGIDLIVSADEGPHLEHIGRVPIVHCQPDGAAVGRVDAAIGPGGLRVNRVLSLPVNVRLLRDPGVEEVLKAFRRDVFEQLGGVAVRGPMKEPAQVEGLPAAFVGADVCSACHKDQHAQWRQTKHARAFDALYEKQRHFVPACLACHTTGYGHPSGYDARTDPAAFRNVQCESCHGPGYAHALSPTRHNVEIRNEPQDCARCHNRENSPQFERQRQQYFTEIEHRRILEAAPAEVEPEPMPPPKAERTPVGPKPVVELFVMSMCPYAIRAENELLPWAKEMKEFVELRVQFIAHEQHTDGTVRTEARRQAAGGLALAQDEQCAGEPEPTEGPFWSLHGQPEVEESIRQAVILDIYPEKAFDYILCRNREIRSPDWRACAIENGIDPDRVEIMLQGPDGEEIFRRNIARAAELGLTASPTVYVDGQRHTGRRSAEGVLAGLCAVRPDAAVCTEQPKCVDDSDCDRPGKVGVCVDAGTLRARCEIRNPVVFDVTVINAPREDCPLCYSGPGLRSILQVFPYARVRSLAWEDQHAQAFVERYRLEAFPAYLFGQPVREAPRFERIRAHLTDVGDHLVLDTGLNAMSYFPYRQAKRGGIDLWVEPHGESSLRVMAALIRHMARRGGYCNFRYIVKPIDTQTQQFTTATRRWKVLDRFDSAHGQDEVNEIARRQCIEEMYPDALYRYILAYNGVFGTPWAVQQALAAVRLPTEKVTECAAGDRAVELLERNYAMQGALRVRTAPTVLINNRLLMAVESIDLVKETYDWFNPPSVGNPVR